MIYILIIFKLIIEFSKYLSQLNDNEFINFFDVYLNYQKNINNNILLINEDEIGQFNSLPLCYRPFYNIDIFRFKVKIDHSCTGICKFANTIKEENYSPPFLELIEEHITNNLIKNIEDFIIKGYYKNRNVFCNEEICLSQLDNSVQTFKYTILEIPPIISIYISMEINNLKKYNNQIKKLLVNDFELNHMKYNILGIILMPSENHFTVLFKNKSSICNSVKNSWYYFDDLNGNIVKIEDVGFNNILESNYICLLIYATNNK